MKNIDKKGNYKILDIKQKLVILRKNNIETLLINMSILRGQ